MLYRPEAFEPLTDEEWNEGRVREAIRTIAVDAAAAFDSERLWPAEEWDAWEARLPLTNLYLGASGVIWALAALQSRGFADARRDLPALALRALESWRAVPDYEPAVMAPAQTEASLFSGESGILLVAWCLAPTDELAERLLERVRENVDNEANELFSGSPGTMLVARAMLGWTGDQRWADAWRASADVLWRRRDAGGLWTYAPYGRGLGASHGAATTANVLLQGGELLAADRRDALRRDTAATLARTAVLEDGLANWPMTAEAYPNLVADDGQVRLQWCHGAAGVIASSAPYLDEDLLLAGAELLASWPARHGEGSRNLPRHGGKRLRVAEGVRAHGRRAVARARAPVRCSRARSGRAVARAPRPRPLLALDRRCRHSSLRRRLPRLPHGGTDRRRPGLITGRTCRGHV